MKMKIFLSLLFISKASLAGLDYNCDSPKDEYVRYVDPNLTIIIKKDDDEKKISMYVKNYHWTLDNPKDQLGKENHYSHLIRQLVSLEKNTRIKLAQ